MGSDGSYKLNPPLPLEKVQEGASPTPGVSVCRCPFTIVRLDLSQCRDRPCSAAARQPAGGLGSLGALYLHVPLQQPQELLGFGYP